MSGQIQRSVIVEGNARFRDRVKIVLGSLGIEHVAEANDRSMDGIQQALNRAPRGPRGGSPP